jgi:ABC-type uncharacterized transport system substrate-binding protein
VTVVQPAAAELKLNLVPLPVQTTQEIDAALDAQNWQPVDALYVMPDSLTNLYAQQIVNLVAARGVRAMYGTKLFADAGGFMYYGRSRAATSRRAADFVNEILNGRTPTPQPIELPGMFELVINRG